MRKTERSDKLRELGLTPTIQRMAVLDCLEKTKKHPTADQVLVTVRKKFPSVSRATIYNTLQALTKAGIIQQITVDPAVARYDADIGPHAHFRCRICNTVYDIVTDKDIDLGEYIAGHHVEAVRTYAYGVCSNCMRYNKSATGKDQKKRSKTSSSSSSSINKHPRKPEAFSPEPTMNVEEKVSKTSSSTCPTSKSRPKKLKASSKESTKEIPDAPRAS